MSKPAETIIEESETRRIAESRTRRQWILNRAGDLAGLGILTVAVVYLSSRSESSAISPVLICFYLMSELRRRWFIEKELNQLKSQGNTAA